jgi:hypothetical protein
MSNAQEDLQYKVSDDAANALRYLSEVSSRSVPELIEVAIMGLYDSAREVVNSLNIGSDDVDEEASRTGVEEEYDEEFDDDADTFDYLESSDLNADI